MDTCDVASDRESLFRKLALNAARQNDQLELPLNIDNIRCCLDCEAPIPVERLNAKPDAVRCVDCQARKEYMESGR